MPQKLCAVCRTGTKKRFSKRQWDKPDPPRRCKDCITAEIRKKRRLSSVGSTTTATKIGAQRTAKTVGRDRARAARRLQTSSSRKSSRKDPVVDLAARKKLYDVKHVSKIALKFTNPVNHLSHDQQWMPREYLVSEKADGQRCLVLCSCDGSVWCLRSKQVRRKQKVVTGVRAFMLQHSAPSFHLLARSC